MKRSVQGAFKKALNDDLLRLADVLFYRFEFGRGSLADSMNYDPVDRGWLPRNGMNLFPRILARKKFLEPGKPSYLTLLKADLNKSGKRRNRHLEILKMHVEQTGYPLCHHASYVWSGFEEPFFPSESELGGEPRQYFYELFALQEYLVKEVGIRPGSLLPVWITGEEKIRQEGKSMRVPVFGCIPIRRDVVGVLMRYLMWEYGHDYDHLPLRPADRNNKRFLHDALVYGRYFDYEDTKVDAIEAHTDISSNEFRAMSPAERKKFLMSSIPEEFAHLRDYPATESEGFRVVFRRDGLPPGRVKNKTTEPLFPGLPKHEAEMIAASGTTAIRKRLRNATAFGQKMLYGGYKDLW